jgi:hypothetical protein
MRETDYSINKFHYLGIVNFKHNSDEAPTMLKRFFMWWCQVVILDIRSTKIIYGIMQ